MKTFLEYVAQDIIEKYGNDLSHIAVVFPNKRASLFLNDALARLVNKPLWSPTYITISDLFRQQSKVNVADPIKLVCDLYKTYIECTGREESLDKFYGWGQLMITDFDDIDKNMADAKLVFANMKDIHELDDISFLSDEQKKILKRFFANFSDDQNSELKKRFLQLWSHFGDIYERFNERLNAQNLAYEGALYRKVVEKYELDLKYDTYLFVGFNMMQKVELRLCDRLMKEGKAKFYWDFDKYYMKNNEAGHYIAQYLKYYPNELNINNGRIYDNMSKDKDITYISASTENIQARYICDWLRTNNRINAGRRTAIVMADESLLPTVIYCLPPEVEKVNITTGFPLAQTPVSSLVEQMIALQTQGYKADSGRFRLHWVNMILHHPFAGYISDGIASVLENLNTYKRFYLSSRDCCEYKSNDGIVSDEALKMLFSELDGSIGGMTHWILNVLKMIGINYHRMLKNKVIDGKDPLFQESLFRMYTLINRLAGLIEAGDLDVDINTYQKLINQLVASTTIPFHGEPAVGIQIMGVLETRNLDFDHVLVLSCNEGNMPKGVNDASFIPYNIRKAYDLTTVDHKVAIYAYYFNRLLQRASDITLAYNNSTNDGQTGEMSRFMLQLMVESKHQVKRENLVAKQMPVMKRMQSIEKDETVMERLNSFKRLSPTALNKYIACQQQFFYRYIADIKENVNEDEDAVDNRTFGNIFHRACQLYYLKFAKPEDYRETVNANGERDVELVNPIMVTKGEIENTLKQSGYIERIVDDAFRELLFKVDQNTKIEYNGLQYINRQVIIDYLRQLLKIDMDIAPLNIVGLEKKVYAKFEFDSQDGKRQLELGGSIDRLDEVFKDGRPRLRVIDYKTGANNSMNVKSVEEIFSGENLKNHTDYFLQTMLYSYIVREDIHLDIDDAPVSPSLLFIQHAGQENYDPTLEINKEKIWDIRQYADEYKDFIEKLLTDIYNPNLYFEPTEDTKRCALCPYAKLCGK